jgi:hypothetical protein
MEDEETANPDFRFERSFVTQNPDGVNSILANPDMRPNIQNLAPALLKILFERNSNRN